MAGKETYDQLKLENQLCFPLYAASRKITSLYTPLLKPLGITYTQYVVLMVLWETDHIQVKDLCKKVHLDNGTITPVIRNLEKEGLVHKSRSTDDERCVYVSLTEKGQNLKEKAKEIPFKMKCFMQSLTKEEAADLYRILYKILNS